MMAQESESLANKEEILGAALKLKAAYANCAVAKAGGAQFKKLLSLSLSQ